jgi:hypothetical protein
MKVVEEFDVQGRVTKQKIAGPYYDSIWTYEYQGDTVIQKRSNAVWTKITNHKDKTSKLIYPDKKEYKITYNT